MEEAPTNKPSADDRFKKVNPSVPAAEISAEARTQKCTHKDTRFRIHWNILSAVFLGIAAFAGASMLIWKTADWIQESVDKSVSAKLSDDSVLRQIAAKVKPSLIFDGRESIISDMGAAQFVKDIRVIKRTKDGWIERIQIDFTRPFSSAPILTALHDSVGVYSERGRMFSWEFEIGWIVEPSDKGDKDRLYRLELIP